MKESTKKTNMYEMSRNELQFSIHDAIDILNC